MNHNTEYKVIYSTFNLGDVAFLKSLFDANNIRYFVEGELVRQVQIGLPVHIKVDATQLETAEELLTEFRKNNLENDKED